MYSFRCLDGEFQYDEKSFKEMCRKMYSNIVDNPNISQDIKEAWLELCVINTDIDFLCR